MTGMLASVVDAAELELAISAGVDIIDLKNPHQGALGALPMAHIRGLVEQTAGRLPVSATVGDLPADPARLRAAVRQTADCGVDYVKVGFFSNDNLPGCLRAIAGLTSTRAVIAVLFADRDPALHRLEEFAAAGFRGVMLDTADKRQGRLLHHIAPDQLGRFVSSARQLGLLSGLAGSLQRLDIPQLLPLAADYLGFRGALCEQGKRVQGISPERAIEIRRAIPRADATGHVALAGQEKQASVSRIGG